VLLWPAFAANPACGVLLLLLAAVAFADPTTGVMIVLALSPVATMAVSTFWGTPGDWAEMVAVAAGLGWLLRQTVHDDCWRLLSGGVDTLQGAHCLTGRRAVIDHPHAPFRPDGKRAGHGRDGGILGQPQAMLRDETAEDDLHLCDRKGGPTQRRAPPPNGRNSYGV